MFLSLLFFNRQKKDLLDKHKEVNRFVKEELTLMNRVHSVQVHQLFEHQGQPQKTLYKSDGLHLVRRGRFLVSGRVRKFMCRFFRTLDQ